MGKKLGAKKAEESHKKALMKHLWEAGKKALTLYEEKHKKNSKNKTIEEAGKKKGKQLKEEQGKKKSEGAKKLSEASEKKNSGIKKIFEAGMKKWNELQGKKTPRRQSKTTGGVNEEENQG